MWGGIERKSEILRETVGKKLNGARESGARNEYHDWGHSSRLGREK